MSIVRVSDLPKLVFHLLVLVCAIMCVGASVCPHVLNTRLYFLHPVHLSPLIFSSFLPLSPPAAWGVEDLEVNVLLVVLETRGPFKQNSLNICHFTMNLV